MFLSSFSIFFKMFMPKQIKILYHLWSRNPSPLENDEIGAEKFNCSSGSFSNKSQKTLHLSHHRLINDDLIFPFYWLGSLGGKSYKVTILVCLSVCLSVPSQNNPLQVLWRLLVEECVSYIGLWSHKKKVSRGRSVTVGT